MKRKHELTAKIEPFDSFWEAPDDIESGYHSFYLFYKDNYLKYLPENSLTTDNPPAKRNVSRLRGCAGRYKGPWGA